MSPVILITVGFSNIAYLIALQCMETGKIEILIQNKQTQDSKLPLASINTRHDLSLFQKWYLKVKVLQRVRKSANADRSATSKSNRD